MIKIRIRKTEIRLLKNGSLKSADQHLLKFVQMLAEDYVQDGSAYFPDPQHAKMQWIAEQIGGKITHYDEDKTIYPPDVCFAAL
jgi:hypothetical protein